MPKQLQFDFIREMDAEIDAEIAEAKKLKAEEMHRRNAESHLKWNVEWNPPENEEWDVMLMGIRLDRFVSNLECESCDLGCYNHCPDCLGMHWSNRHKQWLLTKVCLKDFFAKCKEWGLKEYIRKI